MYPAPRKARWSTAIEFLDGNRVEGVDDADALDRWRMLAAWSDVAATNVVQWQQRIIDRVRVFYGEPIPEVDATTPPTEFLDALFKAGVIRLQRL